jgi:hypothetical protein
MINLLHVAPSETEIAAILAATAGKPALPPLGDTAWASVRNNPAVLSWLTPITARAIAEADEPLPALTDELYADFSKTGARLPFERIYFERRRRLGRVAIAALLGDTTTRVRLLPSFLHKLEEIMEETSWSLPAHVWAEPSGKNPMTIDLFAAETANNFADLLVVFKSVISSEFAQRVKARLRTQVFENYINREPPFHWSTLAMNWNAVCHQGVLGAALAIEDDHVLVARILARAARSLPTFISGFGDDGSTSEGPGYWSYGFGWFSELNAQLEHRTDGKLSFFEDDSKIARISRFAPLMTLSNGHFVNFSDGSRTGRLSGSLLTYLGERLADPLLSAQGLALYHHLAGAGHDLDATRSDFFCYSRLALRAPSPASLATARESVQPDIYFKDYGAIVARGIDRQGHLWEFSAKGGHNDEHHNHNDCGSFLLNIDGVPALIEIGSPEYTRAFFSDQRYTFLAARSLGHSVPFINGCEQPAGREFAATVIKADLGGDRVELVVDLTKCYPPAALCKKLLRTWVLEKTIGRLTVTDTYELDGPGTIESMLICQDAITHDSSDALLYTPGAKLRIRPVDGTQLSVVETCDYRGHVGTDETVQRLRFVPSDSSASGVLRYEITIA